MYLMQERRSWTCTSSCSGYWGTSSASSMHVGISVGKSQPVSSCRVAPGQASRQRRKKAELKTSSFAWRTMWKRYPRRRKLRVRRLVGVVPSIGNYGMPKRRHVQTLISWQTLHMQAMNRERRLSTRVMPLKNNGARQVPKLPY